MVLSWLKKLFVKLGFRKRFFEVYIVEMFNGWWKLNGELIIFFEEGSFVDGWYCLFVCVKSGWNFNSLVVWNIFENVFEIIDMFCKCMLVDILIIC